MKISIINCPELAESIEFQAMYRDSLSLILLAILLLPSRGLSLSLAESFDKAKRIRSSLITLRINEEIQQQERKLAISVALPQLSASSVQTFQDQFSTSSTISSGSSHRHTEKISVEQAIYHGGAVWDALDQTKLNIADAKWQREQGELDLYYQVAQSFYRILSLQQDSANQEEQIRLLLQRVSFLKKRARIGRTRKTEVSIARSQLARITAQKSQTESESSREEKNFMWLTGITSIANLQDSLQLPRLAPPVNGEVLVLESPGLKAKRAELESLDRDIEISKAARYPSLDLSGNYYIEKSGISDFAKWDVNLIAEWNFYTGGTTSTTVSIAKLEHQKARVQYQDAMNQAKFEYAAQKTDLRLKKKILGELELAVKLAKSSYRDQQKDFTKGLISNLEVLRSLDDFLQVKQMYDRERFLLRLTWIRLSLMTGKIP